MVAINRYLPETTLNINGFHSTIKRHRTVEWVKKQNWSFCCFQEAHFIFKDREEKKRNTLFLSREQLTERHYNCKHI